MVDTRFFRNHGPFTLAQLAEFGKATLSVGVADFLIADVAPLDRATSEDVSFFDNPKYLDQFKGSKAAACFVRAKYAEQAPNGMALLVSEDPYRSYALAAQRFYPLESDTSGISPHAHVDPSATLDGNVTVHPGAFVGAQAQIGTGCIIGVNSVIGAGVVIGAHTRVGALCSITHAQIGERVILHRGVQIGQDGFGFAMGREGHVKVPQLGRVIIENDVEIGSNSCIDRGTGSDTYIGAGAKIDNLVQIGHNVQIGRGAVIVAQTGISGSTRIGDGAVLAGQSGIAGHLHIGAGAQVAAQAGVMSDVVPGQRVGGSPAVPIKDWHRQTVALSRLSKPKN